MDKWHLISVVLLEQYSYISFLINFIGDFSEFAMRWIKCEIIFFILYIFET